MEFLADRDVRKQAAYLMADLDDDKVEDLGDSGYDRDAAVLLAISAIRREGSMGSEPRNPREYRALVRDLAVAIYVMRFEECCADVLTEPAILGFFGGPLRAAIDYWLENVDAIPTDEQEAHTIVAEAEQARPFAK